MTKPIVWYIHGANASPRSFAFIKRELPKHDFEDVSYDSACSALTLANTLATKAEQQRRPIYLVGHSLGGLIAIAAAQRSDRIVKTATISSPLGGVRIASLMRWIIPHQVMDDICPSSRLIDQVNNVSLPTDLMCIVSTAGSTPLISEKNDGVVTIASQTNIAGPHYVHVPLNHFEVLLSTEVSDLINGFFFES